MATILISLLAAAIALLGAGIAYGQWHTARQKLVLDLFDKRFAAYDAYRQILNEVNEHNNRDDHIILRLDEAGHRLSFLFGDEICRLVGKVSAATYEWHRCERQFLLASRDGAPAPGHLGVLMASASNARDETGRLWEELEPLLVPYLRMSQRLPTDPIEWLHLRWLDRPDGT